MGFTDQGTPGVTAPPGRLPGGLKVEPAIPRSSETRVNWLFSGVMLGAASWMIVLGVIFAALGAWIIAGALFGGIVLCGLAIWHAGRRLAAGPASVPTSGRHRAPAGSTLA